ELGTRFVPVTVSVNAGPPATAEDGFSPVAVGTGLLGAVMVNVSALDVPRPGERWIGVAWAVPAAAMSPAAMAAVSCVADTCVVARAAPFQRTTELGTRFVPVTVSVNAGPPATAEDGLSPVAVGTGLLPPVTVNVSALDVP